MFYSQYVLAKKGPLGKIWLAAHMEKKVPKLQIISTNIVESVDNIENPTIPMALRVSGHLLLGVVRIFSRKVTYLLTDCSEALVKIKDAFKAPGTIDLPQGATTRRYEDITNPDQFDEMDLETDLATQEMNFMTGDDALVGISIPEVALEPEVGLDEDSQLLSAQQGIEEQEGFGAYDNFEVFFEPQAPDEEAAPPAKRRRGSDPEQGAAGDVEENMLPEVEQFRFADDSEAAGALQGLEEGIARGGQAAEELVQTSFDEPEEMQFAEEEEPAESPSAQPSGLAAAMVTDEPSQDLEAQPSKARRQGEAGKGRKSAKRRMLVDQEVQLTSEFMRSQLQDTTSIVRDVAARAPTASSRAAASDPFAGPPSLAFLPPRVVGMACFQPEASSATRKRSRKTQQEANAAADESEEQWRSAAETPRGSEVEGGVSGLGPFQPDESDKPEDAVHFATFDEAEDMMQPEMEAVGEQPAAPAIPSFEASHHLPNVDTSSESVLLTRDRDSAKKGRKGSTLPDPEAWSKRTHNMYLVLGSAFKESGGMPLSYDAMVAQTCGPDKRRIVAGCFQELLFLTTKGLIDLEQARPYSNIVVSKTARFDSIAVS